MATKYALNYFTTAANANQQQFNFVTPDDQLDRTVTALYVNLATAGVNIQLQRVGSEMAQVDCARFANGNLPVDLNVRYPGGLPIQVLLQDLSGAAHTNVGVLIKYDVQGT